MLSGGTFDISATADQSVKNLAGGSGTVLLGARTLAVASDASTTYGGTIAGSGGLVKTGAGTLTLTAASTTGGAWRIAQGTLVLGDAAITTGGLSEAADATLSVSPRASGAAVNVNGPLNPSGALTVQPAGAVTAGERFTLVHTTGPGAGGTFTGLPEGATFSVGGATFQITYRGGPGHDIVLTAKSSTSANAATHDDGSRRTAAAAGLGGGRGLRLAALAVAAALAALLAGFAIFRARRRRAARPATGRRGARHAPTAPRAEG